jgi:hypothetical protein
MNESKLSHHSTKSSSLELSTKSSTSQAHTQASTQILTFSWLLTQPPPNPSPPLSLSSPHLSPLLALSLPTLVSLFSPLSLSPEGSSCPPSGFTAGAVRQSIASLHTKKPFSSSSSPPSLSPSPRLASRPYPSPYACEGASFQSL